MKGNGTPRFTLSKFIRDSGQASPFEDLNAGSQDRVPNMKSLLEKMEDDNASECLTIQWSICEPIVKEPLFGCNRTSVQQSNGSNLESV